MWGFFTIASFAFADMRPTEVSPGLFISLDTELCTKRPPKLELELRPIWAEKIEILQSPTGNDFFVAICGVRKTTEFLIHHFPKQLAITHVLTIPGYCEEKGCVVTGMRAFEAGSYSYFVSRMTKKILRKGYRSGGEIKVKIQASKRMPSI